MAYLENMGTEGLRILASNLRSEYNSVRQSFYRISTQYYRQPISTSYYKESDIKELLDDLEEKKKRYIKIRDILAGRGVVEQVNGTWSNESLSLAVNSTLFD